jgi:hypothetical protein
MQRLTLKNNFVVNVQSDEQIILWNHVQNLIPYTRITPLFYSGTIAGSEFETYAATKLYIALELEFDGGALPPPDLFLPDDFYIFTYNEANIAKRAYFNLVIAMDGASLWGFGNNVRDKNQYFSRLEVLNNSFYYMKFNGYRLNV